MPASKPNSSAFSRMTTGSKRDYLATLLDAARDHPHAAVVFSDLAVFGTHEGVLSQESVTGTPIERQSVLLLAISMQ